MLCVFREVRNSNTVAEGCFEDDYSVGAFYAFDRLNFIIKNIAQVAVVPGINPNHDIIAPGGVDTFGDLRDVAQLIDDFPDVLGAGQDDLTKSTRHISQNFRIHLKDCLFQQPAVFEFPEPLMDQRIGNAKDLGELRERHAGIGRKLLDNPEIESVKLTLLSHLDQIELANWYKNIQNYVKIISIVKYS